MDEYVKAVERNLKGLDAVSAGSCCPDVCDHSDCQEELDEPFFSWAACECCGTRVGGDRYPAHGLCKESGEVVHFIVCCDCLWYLTYGDVPEDWESS